MRITLIHIQTFKGTAFNDDRGERNLVIIQKLNSGDFSMCNFCMSIFRDTRLADNLIICFHALNMYMMYILSKYTNKKPKSV